MAQSRKAKVLRIAIIQDRKIKQERLIKAGDPVRVGLDPKSNTFVLPSNDATGPSFVLFEPTGQGYALRFTDKFGDKSKVSTGGIAAKLQGLMADSSVERDGDVYSLKLTSQDRGKLDIGGTFILFQFVAPPPVKAVKPLKAMDFRPRLIEDDDPVFFGFLALWSALALVLSVWIWFSEKPVYTLDDYPDRFRIVRVAEPPEPEEPLEIETEDEDPDAASKAVDSKAKAEPEKVEKTEGAKAKSVQDAKENVLQNSKLLAEFLATTGESGSFVESVFDGQDSVGDIDRALAENRGGMATDGDDPGLRGQKGGTGSAADIGELAAVGGGNSGVGGGPAVVVKASMDVGSGTVSEQIGDAGKLKATVRRYSGQMKYCYEEQLKKNQDLEGRVELGWAIYDGGVEAVYPVSNNTGSKALEKCMMDKVKRWKFDKSVEGDVTWPFVFRPSN